MTDSRDKKLPPQTSAKDTSNWDDEAFTILRPSPTPNSNPVEKHAVMEPENPFAENIVN